MSSLFKKLGAFFVFLFSSSLFAQENVVASACRGKIDLGLAYVHVDLLKSGVTRHRMDLPAIKGELSYRFWKCLIVKPTFLYAHARHKDRVCNGGVGLGAYILLTEQLAVSPMAGVIFGNLKTTYNLHLPQVPVPLPVEEKFYASSPYLSLEVSYTFMPACRIVLNYQYSWSHTRTTIKPLLKEKSHSEGPTYSALFEYDLNQHWSVNIGAAYNISLTKEKHGLRAYGYKLGVAYWF